MFLAIFWIFFLAILILGWFSFKTGNIATYFTMGLLVLIVGGVLWGEGLQIESGNQLTYADNGDLNQTLDIYTTQTKENDGLVAFMAWALPPIGLIIILWGIIVPFKPLEEEEI